MNTRFYRRYADNGIHRFEMNYITGLGQWYLYEGQRAPRFKAARVVDPEVEKCRELQLRAYIERWDAYETAPIPDFYDSVVKQSQQQSCRIAELRRSLSETRYDTENNHYEASDFSGETPNLPKVRFPRLARSKSVM